LLLSSSSSSSLLLLLLFMGTSNVQTGAFLECPYKSVVEDFIIIIITAIGFLPGGSFNWQNCTTHKAGVSSSRPPRPPGNLTHSTLNCISVGRGAYNRVSFPCASVPSGSSK
jgi:hypothetical protein